MSWKNRVTLIPYLLSQGLSNAMTAVVEAIDLNSITRQLRGGQPVVVKRRNVAGGGLAKMANGYFRSAQIPISYLSDVKKWQRREIGSFNMLNGDRFRARASGERAIIQDKLPGENLWHHMKKGTLSREMLEATGRELHRAHQFWSDDFSERWSHGDASAPNAIYDERTGRVRWIDFEILHKKCLPAVDRHADDLLVFLLDMVGQVSNREWLSFALCFLRAYGYGGVIEELRKRLILPGGLGWVWWQVRTDFTPLAKVEERLTALYCVIGQLKIHPATRARARQSRRPSIHCQKISPGTPRASSRTRPIKERAKASSPGIPRRPPTKR
jgi:hypothetical protein